MNRRAVVSLFGCAAFAGCLSDPQPSEGSRTSTREADQIVELRIDNGYAEPQTIEMEIDPLDETTPDGRSYHGSFDIKAGSRVRKETTLPVGDYTITVRISNGDTETTTWRLEKMESNAVMVNIEADGIAIRWYE